MSSDANNLPPITLTLGGEDTPTAPVLPAEQQESQPPDRRYRLDDSTLTEEEKKQVREFADKINIRDSQLVLQYGMGAQKNISAFSENALSKVRTKDSGEVGKMLTSLTSELKGFTSDAEPKKGLFGRIKKGSDQLSVLKTRFSSVETTINQIVGSLESHRIQLMKDISMLDQMYDMNLAYFKELTMYIMAGRERLRQAEEEELPALRQKAAESGLQEDAQAVRDYEDMCSRFDKKLYDLDLTRTISIQMAPQIRLVQNNDSMLVEKIQSSIVNTIPLWKNQITLSLGLANSQRSLEAQRAVSDMTNELLKKNADMLKTSTVDIAREAERGIVDIETIQYTNQQLISTIEEVLQIQDEGRKNRRSAEVELEKVETELKQKLLTASNR